MQGLTTPDKRKLQKHSGEMMEHLGEILNAFFLEYLQRYRQEGERIRLRKLKRIKKFSKLWQIKDVTTFLHNMVGKNRISKS